ncbi:hypothetical protein AGMMS49975_18240 [Clostridia bacterium]|nr:hypothetical protein AGMMS49975_18240 [Clostridia bacterium]
MEACNSEFTYKEMKLLNGLIVSRYPNDLEAFQHLVTYRFGYLKTMVRDYGK